MNDCVTEQQSKWVGVVGTGIRLLEKGEKVVMPRPSTPEEKARFLALINVLNEKFGAKRDG